MVKSMNFKEERIGKITAIEQILKKYLPVKEGLQKEIMEAMEYSLLAGGKRLRPMLMRETYVLFGGDEELIEPFMAVLFPYPIGATTTVNAVWEIRLSCSCILSDIYIVFKLRFNFGIKSPRYRLKIYFYYTIKKERF